MFWNGKFFWFWIGKRTVLEKSQVFRKPKNYYGSGLNYSSTDRPCLLPKAVQFFRGGSFSGVCPWTVCIPWFVATRTNFIKHIGLAGNYAYRPPNADFRSSESMREERRQKRKRKKENNIQDSNVITHRSTDWTWACLTSLSRREAVLSS